MSKNEFNEKVDILKTLAEKLGALAVEAEQQSAELSDSENVELAAAFRLLERSIGGVAITAESLAAASTALEHA